nr:MAG TPA: hypothetical protein [Caudoviricetes sp.]
MNSYRYLVHSLPPFLLANLFSTKLPTLSHLLFTAQI